MTLHYEKVIPGGIPLCRVESIDLLEDEFGNYENRDTEAIPYVNHEEDRQLYRLFDH